MIKTQVTKIFKFETAHQLTDSYSKECQEIHGHSYKLEVTFEGPIDPITGMVIDFKLIKEIVQPIVDYFDHSFFTKENYNQNPTAENMANDIFWKIREETLLIVKVKLWETETGFVTVGY
jgi:6-pyruvoyltetrahydropterin/6-carboxytetrahydropterin synthase